MILSALRFGASTASTATTATTDSAAKAKQAGDAAESAFLEESKKTPADRIREQVLKQMNLTEQDLAKMDDKTRSAVEESIRQEILRQAQANGKTQTGVLADVTA
jgi:TPP-dependent pyruvate/acetoin dehydrogenase alpha subunit